MYVARDLLNSVPSLIKLYMSFCSSCVSIQKAYYSAFIVKPLVKIPIFKFEHDFLKNTIFYKNYGFLKF